MSSFLLVLRFFREDDEIVSRKLSTSSLSRHSGGKVDSVISQFLGVVKGVARGVVKGVARGVARGVVTGETGREALRVEKALRK